MFGAVVISLNRHYSLSFITLNLLCVNCKMYKSERIMERSVGSSLWRALFKPVDLIPKLNSRLYYSHVKD